MHGDNLISKNYNTYKVYKNTYRAIETATKREVAIKIVEDIENNMEEV